MNGERAIGIRGVRPGAAALACLLLALVATALDWALSGASLTREGGPIELASSVFYVVAVLAFLGRAAGDRARLWPVPVLLAAMAMRELDWDKRFTGEGILGIKILTRDTAPWEKGLAVLVWVVLLVAIVVLLRRTGKPFLRALRTGAFWAWAVAGTLLLVVISKSLDGLGRKLASLGVEIGAALNDRAGVIEEVLELGIPVLLLMAILGRFPATLRSAADDRDPGRDPAADERAQG